MPVYSEGARRNKMPKRKREKIRSGQPEIFPKHSSGF
jgi:hypothetical protein